MRLEIRVAPGSSRTLVGGLRGGRLLVKVGARAVDGAANEAALSALAQALGLRSRHLSLIAGHRHRDKVVEINCEPSEQASVESVVEDLRKRA